MSDREESRIRVINYPRATESADVGAKFYTFYVNFPDLADPIEVVTPTTHWWLQRDIISEAKRLRDEKDKG